MSIIRAMAVQCGWTPDEEDNLKRASDLVRKGIEEKGVPDIICLPELFYKNPTRRNRENIGEDLKGHFYETFSDLASLYGVNFITGSFPLRDGDRLYNTALALDRKGELIGTYSKAHLFDAFDRRESGLIDPGNSLGIFDFDFGRVGTAICYEVRFPEYMRTIALQNVDMIVIPAAFYRPRDEQWELMVRSAALGNLVYVAAANQCSRYSLGKSMIVNPLGEVMAKSPEGENYIFAELDTDVMKKARSELATYENRRPDLYDVR